MTTAGNSGKRIRAGGLLAMLVLLACCACSGRGETESAQAPLLDPERLAALAQGPQLEGNDNQAWLSRFGGQGDSNYCSARLRLPLESAPAWNWDYSAGSFSRFFVSDMTHFDGRLYVVGYSQQLACLDVDDGTEVFNRFLTGLEEPTAAAGTAGSAPGRRRRGGNGDAVMYGSQCLHPSGKLLLLLGLGGEKQIFDISGGQPECIWQGIRDRRPAGFLLHGDNAVIGTEDSIELMSLDGTSSWSWPLQSSPVDVVRSSAGLIITRNQARNIWAIDETSGEMRWSMADASDTTGMAVDDVHGLLYLCFQDERIDALHCADGSLAWSYDFSYLLDQATREQMVLEANTRIGLTGSSAIEQARMERVHTVVQPEGVSLVMEFGYALGLDANGRLLWERRDLGPVSGVNGFANGLLVQNYWYPQELASQDLFMRASPLPLGEAPQWQSIAANRERLDERLAEHRRMREMNDDEQQEWQRELRRTLRDNPPLQVMYTALQVLDPLSGETLDTQELPGWVRSGFCPARDKIIFEPAGYAICWYMNYWEGGDRRLSAYNWLEPGGDS
ncbi:MAG: PQQ-binding-like beta-propeller repeat protein [bacterium]